MVNKRAFRFWPSNWRVTQWIRWWPQSPHVVLDIWVFESDADYTQSLLCYGSFHIARKGDGPIFLRCCRHFVVGNYCWGHVCVAIGLAGFQCRPWSLSSYVCKSQITSLVLLQLIVNPLRPTVDMGYSYKASCARPDSVVICNFWHPGTLTLRAERQNALTLLYTLVLPHAVEAHRAVQALHSERSLVRSRASSHVIPNIFSECPDVKNYKRRRLNPVCHRMLYGCTHRATVHGHQRVNKSHWQWDRLSVWSRSPL